jgi:hypothetical protein
MLEVATADAQLVTAYTLPEIESSLADLPSDAVIFLDVDDTLITPISKLFRVASPHRRLLDELKRERDKYPHFAALISHWRQKRQTKLISDRWPELLTTLRNRHTVYALTRMDTGSIGTLSSIEKWRYDELAAKGLLFVPQFDGVSEAVVLADPTKECAATFHQGIFFTGVFEKSDVIAAFLRLHRRVPVVLVDDRPDTLESVGRECARQGVPFLGILFKGVELIAGEPDPQVAAFQVRHFLEHTEWLEDEEAESRCVTHATGHPSTHGS